MYKLDFTLKLFIDNKGLTKDVLIQLCYNFISKGCG
ncbi:hypothetical protein SAMN04488529_102146 [Clostridium gasigenes]|uniref:Uncharacterized protein n=1 Tax=Clostridium gasigenes TaxID=94869 RepID=A0A1H0Q1Y9_9CLOT|nr:hypothetical protein SAMN04488529_102146 [Clostridium gasigenes]